MHAGLVVMAKSRAYKALEPAGRARPAELAERTEPATVVRVGLNRRLRGYVSYDPENENYFLRRTSLCLADKRVRLSARGFLSRSALRAVPD